MPHPRVSFLYATCLKGCFIKFGGHGGLNPADRNVRESSGSSIAVVRGVVGGRAWWRAEAGGSRFGRYVAGRSHPSITHPGVASRVVGNKCHCSLVAAVVPPLHLIAGQFVGFKTLLRMSRKCARSSEVGERDGLACRASLGVKPKRVRKQRKK